MQALIGLKKVQSQRFLENGMRIPVTLIDVKDNCVIAVKTTDRNHYQAVQLGFSMKKKASKAELGHAKGAKQEKAPKFLREVRILDDSPLPEVGSIVNPAEVFQPGDIVNISGISKGKGFAGVVKRHGFHGGPKTHGQSDRHRAPGAIGQGTTPGRVYRGKRMAGRMGNENVTIRNLEIVDVTADGVLVVKGLVPGIINSLITVKKVGEDKKFVPLWKESDGAPAEEKGATGQTPPSDDAPTSAKATVDKQTVEEEGSTTTEGPSEQSSTEEKPAEEAKEEVKEKEDAR
ncbi:MAG: 50S ribosomal protein L3 [Microgenomates group bacterium GW2011_GWA2_37_6]|nr:MAG: 50S ribosomal protein L3 [Microgenomates group bacterium GW2011_GWA2_37_6]